MYVKQKQTACEWQQEAKQIQRVSTSKVGEQPISHCATDRGGYRVYRLAVEEYWRQLWLGQVETFGEEQGLI